MTSVNFKLINVNNIEYLSPTNNETFYISLANISDKLVYFTSPKMKCIKKEIIDNYIILEFEFSKNQWLFFQFISGLDEQNIKSIDKYSEKWFGQNFPINIIDDFYISNLKFRKGLTVPIIKFKFKNDIKLNNDYTIKNIGIGSYLVLDLKYIGLKFLKQQVFCEWKCNKVILFNPVDYNLSRMLSNFSDDEDKPETLKSQNIKFKKFKKKSELDILNETLEELENFKKNDSLENDKINFIKKKINNLLCN